MKTKILDLKRGLLALRLGVFIVMFMWTLDKFINPGHAQKVFSKFYMIGGLENGMTYLIGALQMLLILGFLLGVKKRWTYGSVLLMHLVSTVSSYMMYLDPWKSPNLLFFAAWPMLAAIYCLYLLREDDSLMTINNWS